MAPTTPYGPAAARLAALASLLADETRAAFCLALLDGRAWTAGELARHAGVAPSTASEHLAKLVAGGLLTGEKQGRHRYVRLADERAARLIEELTGQALAGGPQEPPRSLRAATVADALARGRTCYDHLAGRLGIAITDAMTARGLLRQETGFALTDHGIGWFAALGAALPAGGRRPLARGCLDWTERRPHLAGVAGAALCGHALEQGWCVRIGSGRAVRATPDGESALRDLLGVRAETIR
ncbi:helix-turn-helix transcriptional regulator [uncultured Streptomyces sp.]|uniref:ArsR/SmtB family transcription factor n=1 Tax=uncultured Streptomyces sp. TaxID=174707 RepID=UPI0026223FD8|nr:helix-turn-helix domain-containing protein [uncultured Streptomyces sp.]